MAEFSVTLEPRLPPKLEHRIFEIASTAHPGSIPSLMLVAWRVKDWVEPLLYRTVIVTSSRHEESLSLGIPTLDDETLQRLITERAPTMFQRVQSLFIDYYVDQSAVESFLAACTGITTLFFGHSRSVVSSAGCVLQRLGALRGVQFLTIDARAIFEPLSTGVLRTLFLTVTHIELLQPNNFDDEEADRVCACHALFPRLTHVAFNYRLYHTVSHAGLHANKRLQCVVFLALGSSSIEESDPLFGDSRFVCIEQNVDYRLDWMRGAVSGEDYWAFADAFIAAKREGKVDRTPLDFPHGTPI